MFCAGMKAERLLFKKLQVAARKAVSVAGFSATVGSIMATVKTADADPEPAPAPGPAPGPAPEPERVSDQEDCRSWPVYFKCFDTVATERPENNNLENESPVGESSMLSRQSSVSATCARARVEMLCSSRANIPLFPFYLRSREGATKVSRSWSRPGPTLRSLLRSG